MTSADPFGEGAAAAKARRMRSIALAVGLLAFVAVIFFVTMARIAANVAAHTG